MAALTTIVDQREAGARAGGDQTAARRPRRPHFPAGYCTTEKSLSQISSTLPRERSELKVSRNAAFTRPS